MLLSQILHLHAEDSCNFSARNSEIWAQRGTFCATTLRPGNLRVIQETPVWRSRVRIPADILLVKSSSAVKVIHSTHFPCIHIYRERVYICMHTYSRGRVYMTSLVCSSQRHTYIRLIRVTESVNYCHGIYTFHGRPNSYTAKHLHSSLVQQCVSLPSCTNV